jgi:tetratricopeptide (TPR) repeat protein
MMKRVSGEFHLFRRLSAGVLALAMLSLAAPAGLKPARELYDRTEYSAALKLLISAPEKDAAAYALIGQCYYMQGDPKRAADSLQKAIALSPTESNYYLWLGRALGRRAQASSFLTAPSYAGKARDAFERAVQLNPRNLDAVTDLFEYYLEAPGILGGGLDKAAALTRRMMEVSPADAYCAQARLAEKRKEFGKAEQHLRRAAELAPRQAGRLIDLAKFLSRTGRYQESDEAFRKAEAIEQIGRAHV